jgi:hypothetical protein
MARRIPSTPLAPSPPFVPPSVALGQAPLCGSRRRCRSSSAPLVQQPQVSSSAVRFGAGSCRRGCGNSAAWIFRGSLAGLGSNPRPSGSAAPSSRELSIARPSSPWLFLEPQAQLRRTPRGPARGRGSGRYLLSGSSSRSFRWPGETPGRRQRPSAGGRTPATRAASKRKGSVGRFRGAHGCRAPWLGGRPRSGPSLLAARLGPWRTRSGTARTDSRTRRPEFFAGSRFISTQQRARSSRGENTPEPLVRHSSAARHHHQHVRTVRIRIRP